MPPVGQLLAMLTLWVLDMLDEWHILLSNYVAKILLSIFRDDKNVIRRVKRRLTAQQKSKYFMHVGGRGSLSKIVIITYVVLSILRTDLNLNCIVEYSTTSFF